MARCWMPRFWPMSIALTGGQFSLDILDEDPIEDSHAITTTRSHSSIRPYVLRASEAERPAPCRLAGSHG